MTQIEMYCALIHSKNKHTYKKIKEIIQNYFLYDFTDKIIGLIKVENWAFWKS